MMWLIRMLLLAAVATGHDFQCGVTQEWEKENAELVEKQRRLQTVSPFQRSATLGPLRIHAEYMDMSQITNATLLARVKNIIIPGVINWYSKVLQVYNLAENWKLSQTSCSSITVPAAHQNPGLPNVDYVIYVYTANEPTKNYIAKAGFCALDGNILQNPIAGTFAYNTAFFVGMSFEQEISITRHEITHALAFSSSLYPRYRQADGTLYPNPVVSATIRGSAVTMLTTPMVVLKARAGYGCATLTGLELENDGGAGTAGSHWEKRLMLNDYMVGTLGLDTVYSDITLAAFEDSGWYKVNYDYTDPITFGRGEGCDFINKKCVISGVAQFPEFCVAATNSACSPTFTRKATCMIGTFTTAPPVAYQYFTDPLTDGTDTTADYCPYLLGFDNGDCWGGGMLPSSMMIAFTGETVCDTCMCFTGTYRASGYVLPSRPFNSCQPVTCSGGVAYVKLGTTTVTCPVAGGQVTGITGYTGYMDCPPYDKLCGPKPCRNACAGYGKCVVGVCVCETGRSGADCSIVCDATCKSCTGTAATQCASCYDGANLANGSCIICGAGYGFDMSTKACVLLAASCDVSCLTCTGATNTKCSTCVANATVSSLGSCLCNDGYTRSTDGATCVACDPTCAKCSGTSASSCTACKTNAALPSGQTTGACTCNTGFFLKADNTCGACHTSCKTCTSDTSTSCSSCKPATATVSNTGACVCATAYYLTTDGLQCLACDVTCSTCSAAGSSACLTCKPATAVLTNGVCACPANYYMSSNGSTCGACDTTCQACSTSGTSGCTACYPLGVLTPTSGPGSCGCATGKYYTVPDGCQSCHSSCATCSGSAATQCLSCQAGSPTATGECPCPSSTFMDTSGACVACSLNCSTCVDSATKCTACDTTVAVLATNQCTCLSTAFLNASSKCVACHATCLTCSAETTSSCLTCVVNSTRTSGACLCNSGYARSADSKQCVSCHPSCATCSGLLSTNCSSCLSNATLQTGNTCSCNSGYYMKTDSTCAACHIQCATCSGPSNTNCLSCKGTATVQVGVCVCTSHKFLSADGSACTECDALCQTCSATGASSCLSCFSLGVLTPTSGPGSCSCASGYYYTATGCQACYSTCLTCIGTLANQCTSCNAGAPLAGPAPNSCGCGTGFIVGTTGCLACDANCKTCANTTSNCTSCDTTVSALSGNVCNCLSRYYKDTTGACVACDSTCLTCSTGYSSGCVSCYSNAAVASSPGLCVCSVGFYPNPTSKTCTACDRSCKQCTGLSASMCTDCFSPAMLVSGFCLCAVGLYFDPATSTCKTCAVTCKSCSGATDALCLTCYPQAALSAAAPSTCTCVAGTTPKPNSANCGAGLCDVSCKTCVGDLATQCSACYANAVGTLASFPASCACAPGYYPSPNAANCMQCGGSCATCSGFSQFLCTSCAIGKVLISGMYCGSECPVGQVNQSNGCVSQSGTPSFRVQLDTVNLYLNDTISLLKVQSGSSSITDTNDPTAYYQQGWLFDGSNDYLVLPPNSIETGKNVLLDSTHSVEIWVRAQTITGLGCAVSKSTIQNQSLNVLLRLCVTDTRQLQLDFSAISISDPTITVTKSLVGGKVLTGWVSLSYKLTLSSKSSTTAILAIDRTTVVSVTYPDFIFKDSIGTGDIVKFIVGAAYTNYQTMGSFFKGNIAEMTIFNSDSMAAPGYCGCTVCTGGGLCLSPCLATQYQASPACADCMTTCSNGCIRGTDCRANADPLCATFTSFVGCQACMDLSELSSASVCQCVSNSALVSGVCACSSGYQKSGNKCVQCLTYFQPSQVTAYFDASFLRIVIEFAISVASKTVSTCDTLLLPGTAAKLGIGYSCAWASDEMSVSVLIGMNATIVNEKLSLNYVNLYANQGNCSFAAVPLEPVATYRYPLPTVSAKLTLPSTFSLPCTTATTIDLDASGSIGGKGRPMNYTWTISSNPYLSALYTYTSYKTGEPVLSIPKSLLSNSVLTIVVTVRNYFGGESTATGSVEVMTGSAITLTMDVGSTIQISASSKLTLKATPSQLCASTLSLQYTWSLLSVTPTLSGLSLPFLSMPSPPNMITIPANTLQPGYSYTFSVKATDGQSEGKVSVQVIVVRSPLVAQLDRTASDVGVDKDFMISGEKSTDPDSATGPLGYLWGCLDSGSICVDSSGTPVVSSENQAKLTITQAKLRENHTWNITLTVSKDVRSAFTSISVRFVSKTACDFTQEQQVPLRVNAQVKTTLKYHISAGAGTNFAWTQIFGPSLTVLTPLTYPYLVIGGNAISAGEAYGFSLTATNAIGNSSAQIYFKADYPPTSGTATVTPSSGIALSTVFTILASSWEDPEGDYPLSYYVTYNSNGYQAAIGPRGLRNTVSFKGRVGTFALTVSIYDSLSSRTQVMLPTIAISKPGRLLQSGTVLNAFLNDVVNTDLTFQMVSAYAGYYKMDNLTFAGVVSTWQAYVTQLPEIGSTELDACITSIEALLTQTQALTIERLSSLLTFLQTGVIARATVPLSDDQMAYLNSIMGRFQGNSTDTQGFVQGFMGNLASTATAEALPDQIATTFTSSRVSTYSRRISSSTLSGLKVSSGSSTIQLPRDILSSLSLPNSTVFDLRTATILSSNAISNLVNITLFSAGCFTGYTYEPAAIPSEIVVRNLSTPVSFSVTVRGVQSNLTYICVYLTPSGQWSSEGVNLTSITDNSATCNATHLSTFQVIEKTTLPDIPATVSPPSETTPTSDTCRPNYAPTAIIIALAVLGSILTISLRVLKRKLPPPVSAENRFRKKDSESLQLYKGLDMINEKPPTPAAINFSVATEGPNDPFAFPKPSFFRQVLESHGIACIFLTRSRSKKWSKSLTLTIALCIEIVIVGLFYSKDVGADSKEAKVAWTSYSTDDFRYVPAGLAVGFGISTILSLLLTVADRTRAGLRKFAFGVIATLSGGIVCAAIAGTAHMNAGMCFEAGGKWAVSVIPIIAGEIFVCQSLIAVGRAVGVTIASEV